MKRIILDTNAVMAIAGLQLDIFSALEECCDFHYEIYILEGTIDELEKIQHEQPGKHKAAAKLGLALLKARDVEVIPSKGLVDDILVKYSKLGDLVLTQDKELRNRLKRPYLTIRQKKKVILVK